MKKIETFIPAEVLERLQDALMEACVGRIGNYAGCMTWYPVMGSWVPDEDARPYCGGTSGRVTVPEIKVEFLVSDERVAAAKKAVLAVHPYEEPVINIFDVVG